MAESGSAACHIQVQVHNGSQCRSESSVQATETVSVLSSPVAHCDEWTSQVVGSRATALETVLVLRQVVSKARFSNIEQLVEIIRQVGRQLVEAQPKGLVSAVCSV
jgi:hypothetical protein